MTELWAVPRLALVLHCLPYCHLSICLHMGTPKCFLTAHLKLAEAAAISVLYRHFRSTTRSVSASAKEDGHARADGNCRPHFCPLYFTVAVIKLQFLPGGTLSWNYQMSTTTWRHLCHCDTANLMMPLHPYNAGLWSDLFQCVWLHDFKMKHKLIWCCIQTPINEFFKLLCILHLEPTFWTWILSPSKSNHQTVATVSMCAELPAWVNTDSLGQKVWEFNANTLIIKDNSWTN